MIDSTWVAKRSLQAYGLLSLGRIFQNKSEVPPKSVEAECSRKSSESSHYASIAVEKEQYPEARSAGGSGKSPDMRTEHTKDPKRDQPITGPAHHQPQTEEVGESCKDASPSEVGIDFKIKLISKKDGHRAPPAAPWLTDEELWFMDWAFRDTVKELLAEGIAFELSRFQGTPNFPPLLLDRGYGVALCIRRLKAARDVGPLNFNSCNDEAFAKKLHSLAYDVTTSSFRHKDLIWSIRITTFFAHIYPANAPVWWRPGAEMDKEECEFASTSPVNEVPQMPLTDRGRQGSLSPSPQRKQVYCQHPHFDSSASIPLSPSTRPNSRAIMPSSSPNQKPKHPWTSAGQKSLPSPKNKLLLSSEETKLSQRDPNSATSGRGREILVGKENGHDNPVTNQKAS